MYQIFASHFAIVFASECNQANDADSSDAQQGDNDVSQLVLQWLNNIYAGMMIALLKGQNLLALNLQCCSKKPLRAVVVFVIVEVF